MNSKHQTDQWYCQCGHHFTAHGCGRIAYGDDGYVEEDWSLRCLECDCQDYKQAE